MLISSVLTVTLMRHLIAIFMLFVIAACTSSVDSMTAEQKEQAMQKALQETPMREMTDIERMEEKIAVGSVMEGRLLKTAPFTGRAHDTSGVAKLVEKDGAAYLVLSEDFATDAGPDLHVILAENNNPQKSADLHEGAYVDLGSLKSTNGMQVYPVPREMVEKFQSVSVYCKPFKVIFGAGQFT